VGKDKSMVFAGMGFELVIMVLGAAYLGKYVDEYFRWPGYGSAGLILAFLGTWFYHLLILLKKFNEDDEGDHSNGP
jgi:hypothetical protein